MESGLFYIVIALSISVVLNLVLKKMGISQIIGYIATGTIMMYSFDLQHAADSHTLELIGEFGIVFLMFTIGLEISLPKLNTMKEDVFINGNLQMGMTSIVGFVVAHYGFMLDYQASIIIALAFSLSSTAVVLSHLKASKEIYTPYGQKATGILIFQDIAVIPIILLIGFFATDEGNVQDIIIHTTLSAVVLVGILLIVGKRVMTYLLHFSASSDVDELFMGSILLLVMGASFMAHEAGFTYSLGAFIVGMLIAETKYHAKVESDISPFKDVLLGTFFITVGMKIDLAYLFSHTLLIISLLVAIILVKSIIIFMIIRFRNNSATALKSALSLAQVGEFSFAVFALAASSHLMEHDLIGLLILIIAGSMIITPFIISNVNSISTKIFHKEEVANDFSNVAKHHNYAIVCGYSIVGKMVAKRLKEQGLEYIIIDNSLKHVKEGLAANEEIFFGDLSRQSIAKSLHIENSASVIITLDNPEKRALICDAVLKTFPRANIVVKINSDEEREKLAHFDLRAVVDGKREVANILVEQTVSCKL
jgi:monovalent cation:H+ antiporter-2, CPA2 family